MADLTNPDVQSELAARRYSEQFDVPLIQARGDLQDADPEVVTYKATAMAMAAAGQLDYLLSPEEIGTPGAPPLLWKWIGRTRVPTCVDAVRLVRGGFSDAEDWNVRRSVPGNVTDVVWHTTEGHLSATYAVFDGDQAGAHLVVDRDGTCILVVPIEKVPHHAGTNNIPNSGLYGRHPIWRRRNINPHSIGVELIATADRRWPSDGEFFTVQQQQTIRRIADWATEYGIPRACVIDQFGGHHAHSEVSSSRRDPGNAFDWSWVL